MMTSVFVVILSKSSLLDPFKKGELSPGTMGLRFTKAKLCCDVTKTSEGWMVNAPKLNYTSTQTA